MNINSKRIIILICGAIVFGIAAITDAIDGKLARKNNQITTFGKLLDPVADKLTQFTLTLCLSINYPVLRLVLVLFVIKEGFQGIVGLVNLQKGKMLPGALMAGKVCTTVLFVSLIILVLIPDLKSWIVVLIATVDFAFLSFAFITYIFAYFGKNTKVQDLEE